MMNWTNPLSDASLRAESAYRRSNLMPAPRRRRGRRSVESASRTIEVVLVRQRAGADLPAATQPC